MLSAVSKGALMIQSVLAVLSGPVVYGLVCVPTNMLVARLFPDKFRDDLSTEHLKMQRLLILLSFIYAVCSGLVCGWLAANNIMVHVGSMSAIQLGIGIMVQRQNWNVMPVWYHYSFFGVLVT
jgi:hypothetical protein